MNAPHDPSARAAETFWLRLDDPSAVGAARRYSGVLAAAAGFDEARTGELGIAVTELAGNAVRHARDGWIALRADRPYLTTGAAPEDVTAIDVVTVDAGPGMADLEENLRDGYSTAGTLGVGLGAVQRLASGFDAYSMPERGTVIVARFDARRRSGRIPQAAPPSGRVAAGLTRPMSGETACGDAYAVRATPTGMSAVLCDGLGHGPLAALAARRGVEIFLDSPDTDVVALLTRIHRGLGHTRGAAVGVVRLDRERGSASYAGLGNIAGTVTARERSGHRSRHLSSMAGIAGHQARTIRSFDYPIDDGSVVVLHSDGLSTRWSFDGQWTLPGRDPLVVAAALLRDAGTRRDDAGIVVVRSDP